MVWRGDASARVAKSVLKLFDQLDQAYPNRSRASDGTIGDAAHRAEGNASDHNPWYPLPKGGIVTAGDYTHDPGHGVDIDRLSDELAASRDPRIKYIIANGWILDSRPQFNPWKWVKYTGASPHREHLHLSVMDSGSCDDNRPWNLPMLAAKEIDMTPDERDALYDVREQLTGARPIGQYPGWPAREDLTSEPKTIVDYVRATHAEVTKFIDARPKGGPINDTVLGHAASADGLVTVLNAKVDSLNEKVDAILKKLAA